MTYMSIIVPTFLQPIRKTKRRELNKHKQQGRHHRQQTPPPPPYYGIDEDIANDEYGNISLSALSIIALNFDNF